jgi:hypothetical protein
MTTPEFSLAVPTDTRARLARGWLLLGVCSLLASGIFALLLVLARTPGFQHVIPWESFFHTALVVHVDLSVLVWFVAFGGVLWSIAAGPRLLGTGGVALALAALGSAMMALAPFVAEGNPLINNYVPVLQQRFFLTGLGCFGLGAAVLVLRTLVTAATPARASNGAMTLHIGLIAAALSALVALVLIVWAAPLLPATLDARQYYELLFWGGGHTLQFVYTLLMLVAWLWIASAADVAVALPARVVLFLVVLGFVPVLATPVAQALYPVTSAPYVIFFSLHMQYAGGIAAAPLALVLLYGLWRAAPAKATARALRAALLTSVVLFSVGGVIGFLIQGTNVTIPAHYHGSIVGVTLAFMGLTYHLLPKLGYREPERRWAFAQPLIYGGGQLLHISGLAWSGGYGVQRKVAGAAQVLEGFERKAAMGVMGLGGLIAIAGGLIFLVIVFRAMRRK